MSSKRDLIFLKISSASVLVILLLDFSVFILLSLDIMQMNSDFSQDFEEFHIYSEEAWASMNMAVSHSYKPRLKRGYYRPIPYIAPPIPACVPKPGPPGAPGQRGLAGEPGNHGENGLPGTSGFELYKEPMECILCPMGPVGPPGSTGQPGSDGPPGFPGEDSFYVFVGAPGPPGQSGDPGCCGKPGDEGPPGFPGRPFIRAHNLPGPPGKRGGLGRCGAPGEPGLPAFSPPGPIGLPGSLGNSGCPGTPGLPGPSGRAGEPGEDAEYCSCPIRDDTYPNSPTYKNTLVVGQPPKSYLPTPAPPPPPPPPHHAPPPSVNIQPVTRPVYPAQDRYPPYNGYNKGPPELITSDKYASNYPQYGTKPRRPLSYRPSPYETQPPPPPPYNSRSAPSYPGVPPPSYSPYYTGGR